jgi:hypothetical protein
MTIINRIDWTSRSVGSSSNFRTSVFIKEQKNTLVTVTFMRDKNDKF